MYFTTEEGTGYLRVKEAIITITKEHLQILDAFKKKDPDLARQKVQTHVMNALERTIDAIRNYTSKEQS
jgi:DNA-binding GntR family transcriptional regulator